MKSNDFYTRTPECKEYNIIDSVFAEDQHPSLKQLEETYPQINLNDYNVYGVLRNPIERFFSLFSQVLTLFSIEDVSELDNEQIAEKAFDLLFSAEIPYHYAARSFDNVISAFPLLPQSHWLIHKNKPINKIIIYPHFKSFLREITDNDNLKCNFNSTFPRQKTNLSREIIETIRHFYADDFLLWERFGEGVGEG
jgi:hypothetical protein